MAMQTSLKGRLRNTDLPQSHGLLPLFEAVVNSIHAIDACSDSVPSGKITVRIIRDPQSSLDLKIKNKRGNSPLEPIKGFTVEDNGEGFTDLNFSSFETLDSELKIHLGCRGVGRLLWLKAFQSAHVESTFKSHAGHYLSRTFSFTVNGVERPLLQESQASSSQTSVTLDGFRNPYKDKSPKSARTIAEALLEHCLWYFVRPGGAPQIDVIDSDGLESLQEMYEKFMHSQAKTSSFNIGNEFFEVTHLKLKNSPRISPSIAWCAAGRVVINESISGKIPGLFSKIFDEDGEFTYVAYLTSNYLDEHVRPERTDFALKEDNGGLGTPGLAKIREETLRQSKEFLDAYLRNSLSASRERVQKFVRERAPRYRTILKHVTDEKLAVDPSITDKELDLLLHKHYAEVESEILEEGYKIMSLAESESASDYQARLESYLSKVDDVKKSDLADYVFHRKVVLDVLRKAIERQPDGKYLREDLIHEFIMPMRKTSNDVHLNNNNLWLLDERLAFHDFLASDKTLQAIPITGSSSTKEPDIIALNVFDEPLLVSDKTTLPLASIVVVEIKRPMRNDAAEGEEKDPITQALSYLERVRQGGVTTATGRPIPGSDSIPGFCYIVCDITPTMQARCKQASLTITNDKMGYFGYNDNYKAYIEVSSYDRLLSSAEERNRAFFSKLGLPTN